MNTKLSESTESRVHGERKHGSGQALENLPSKDGKALSAEPTHIIFRRRPLRGFGKQPHHSGQGGRCGERNWVKATTEGFPGETNFSVICEDGSFFHSTPSTPVNRKCSISK